MAFPNLFYVHLCKCIVSDGDSDPCDDLVIHCIIHVFLTTAQFVTPENDPDIDADLYGPFGSASATVDWSGPSMPKPAAIASQVPTVSSVTGSSSVFDMTQLKMEVSSKFINILFNLLFCFCFGCNCFPYTGSMDSHTNLSTLPNGRASPDTQRFTVSNMASFLGFGKPGQCSETYSRKVFIGGLPPDVDESTRKQI